MAVIVMVCRVGLFCGIFCFLNPLLTCMVAFYVGKNEGCPYLQATKRPDRKAILSAQLHQPALRIIMSITFITGNKKKLEEVLAILGDSFPYEMVSASLELPELQGEPEHVAIEKCKWASEQVDGPIMVEDTSLCFNALGGLPGVYIKYFLEKTGHTGLNNIISAYPDKSAYAQCIFAYTAGKGQEVITFVGRTDGSIVPARGPVGSFGWDPVFQPTGFAETYAEMDKNIKNTISHRYRALDKLRSHLIKQEKEKK